MTVTAIKATATCIDIARAAGLSGGTEKGGEVYFNAPYREDGNPSLRINIEKDCWFDDPAGRGGDYWSLTAAIIGAHPNDKQAIKAWLNEHGLSNGNGNGSRHSRIVAEYNYRNLDGEVVFQVVRKEPGKNGKSKGFSQRRPGNHENWIWDLKGVSLVPYRLNEWIDKDTVFFTEGERHADLLWKSGIPATTNPMGAGQWREEYNEHFTGKNVAILPDNDDVGRNHAQAVSRNILPLAKAVKIITLPRLPEKGDIIDWFEAGHTKKELFGLVRDADTLAADSIPDDETYRPDEKPSSPWASALPAPDLLRSTEEEVAWLDYPLLAPGSITEVFSPRGLGKTHVALSKAVSQARKGRRVLLLDRDNSRREVRRRLAAWGAADTPTLHVMTRDEVPPLTDTVAWASFPFKNYDMLIIDSLDSTTEGVGEQDSSKPSRAIAPLLDIAHRADGPAILVLGNTIKNGDHSRGSGIVEDRADICFEVRDATGLNPSGDKPWWEELPAADAGAWAEKAARRKRRDSYQLAFIPSKFRVGEEPNPFIFEIDLSADRWTLRDVTERIEQAGSGAREAEIRDRQEKLDRAMGALQEWIIGRRSNKKLDTLLDRDAVAFLREQHQLSQKMARTLITENDGRRWTISTQTNMRGKPKLLLPLTAEQEELVTETDKSNRPLKAIASEGGIPVTPMDTGQRKYSPTEPLPVVGSDIGGYFRDPPVDEEGALETERVKL